MKKIIAITKKNNINTDDLIVVKETLNSLTAKNIVRKLKTKGLVNCSGKKIAAQKKRGRARGRTFKTNLNRGGAVAFGISSDNSFKQSKMKKFVAMQRLITKLIENNSLYVSENLDFPTISCKNFLNFCKDNQLVSGLFVDDSENVKLVKSIRNLKDYDFIDYRNINPLKLLSKKFVIFSQKSWDFIREKYSLEVIDNV